MKWQGYLTALLIVGFYVASSLGLLPLFRAVSNYNPVMVGAVIVIASGSPNTVVASANVTPCLRKLSCALCLSHSNRKGIGQSFVNPQMLQPPRLTTRSLASMQWVVQSGFSGGEASKKVSAGATR
jgi:hypothetical protein